MPTLLRLGLARVHGRSMEPTLREGDVLLVLHGGRPRLGRLLVVRLPGGVLAVKRAVRREPDGWWVERDNPLEGVDSWSVGTIPDRDVVARVLARVSRRSGSLLRRVAPCSPSTPPPSPPTTPSPG